MTTTTAEAEAPSSTGTATTLNTLFLERAQAMPERVALRRKVAGVWEDVTWRGYREAATKIGLALRKLGLEKGDPVGLLSNTRAEWAFCDMGILGAGGITVPIYQSSLAKDVRFILENSGAKFLFLEDLDQYAKVEPALDELGELRHVILLDPSDTQKTKAAGTKQLWREEDRVRTFDAFLELASGEDPAGFDAACREAGPDDPITFIYTSGTTGNPKGVVLTHANAIGECAGIEAALQVTEDDVTLAFLPLAHVFARVMHWMQLKSGYVTAFAEEVTKVVDNMGEIRPTFFAAVPRIYEKIHQAVIGKVHANGGFKTAYALWALEGAIAKAKAANEGKGAGVGASLRCALGGPALNKLKAGLQERTGGRVKFFISGGAPLGAEIAFFLQALGFTVYEGYGLTETTAATHLNRPGAAKIGTVGKPVLGAACKIAEDGEILLKGTMIMQGYYENEAATAEVLRDGWFHSGDIGEIDAEGFLRITDRKKDLIVTAAGKNIAPQNVENHIKTHPLVSQVALFGDKQKFCVALLTIDEEATRKALATEGAEAPADYEALTKHPRVRELLTQAIKERNVELASYETVKYFELLPRDFEIGDELTPTLKVKRRVIKDKYGDLVDALYKKYAE